MITFIVVLYLLALAALSLYGFLGLLTLWLYWQHRRDELPPPPPPLELPPVTVQLPLYNEPFVVEQLIDTAVALDYPRDKLQIQVLDDSTDATTQIAAARIARYQTQGINIQLLHRTNRQGYKAGALANALPQTSGEYIAIFDADFQPPADFLRRAIPHFLDQPKLGMIQARWGHLNDHDSPLTAAQAIALDKHFVMEQNVRHWANLFPKFNGTGGIWRRTCLVDAGGWQDDTVCEDLCLSTRAILGGWQFRFLNDLVAPAELPATISAYKNQQARWAKGSSQCLLKFSRPILADRQHSLTARLYALFSMSAYGTHLLLITLLLLQIPLILSNYHLPAWLLFFSIAGLGQPLLFAAGQMVLYADWPRRLRHLPVLLLIAIGLAPTNARATLEAFFQRKHVFIRTPKQGGYGRFPQPEPLQTDWIVAVEIFLLVYAILAMILAIQRHNFGPLPFLFLCALGLGYVALLTLGELRQPTRPSPKLPPKMITLGSDSSQEQ